MKKFIVANWKLNIPNLATWKGFSVPENVEVVICPPFPYLTEVKKTIGPGIKLGAQDVFWENPSTGGGPFTGEISASMLKKLSVEYVLVGHSERRKWLGETDEMVNKKVLAALEANLKAILCVGEAAEVRTKGTAAAKRFVENQLKKNLRTLHAPSTFHHLIVAYEPIWAIGTGTSDKPEDSNDMAAFIKSTLHSQYSTLKVLYGGSVTSKNAKQFLMQKDIDGALVGGASLNPKEFGKIASIASHASQA